MTKCNFNNATTTCSVCGMRGVSRDTQLSIDCPGAGGFVSRGIGDTLAKLTNVLGIPQCESCKKRQALLNQLLPYGT